jgi:tRNA-specific adenosine deaminase 3
VLSSLRTIIPTSLQHLRRLTRLSFLPPSVISKLPPPSTTTDEITLYLLVCPTSDTPIENLKGFLCGIPPFSATNTPPIIATVPVPSSQPISKSQADEWSSHYWPTVYKGANPYGPHSSIVSQGLRGLKAPEKHILFARQVGAEAAASGIGLPFGAVMVDPDSGEVVAAAGDARLRCNEKGWGNPLDHAVMIVIDMVAQRQLGNGVDVRPGRKVEVWDGKYLAAEAGDEGYLCHNLQVYLSHEPCVMCSMALLHSRVGSVVFQRRMLKTGALSAEERGKQLGLFWRPELTWKFLCWQWKSGEVREDESIEEVDV